MAILITNSSITPFKEGSDMKEALTKMIEEVASQGPSFLNSEGGTTVKDFFHKISVYVLAVTGWETFVEFKDSTYLNIKIKNADSQYPLLLSYDVINKREIYGRVKYVGFTEALLKEICEFDYANSIPGIEVPKEPMSSEVKTLLHVTGKKDQLENHPDLLPLFQHPKMTVVGYVVPNMVVAKFNQEDFDQAQKLYNILGDRSLVRFRNWLDAR